jgi:hypothetical protein
MAQKPMLRADVNARAPRASQNVKTTSFATKSLVNTRSCGFLHSAIVLAVCGFSELYQRRSVIATLFRPPPIRIRDDWERLVAASPVMTRAGVPADGGGNTRRTA